MINPDTITIKNSLEKVREALYSLEFTFNGTIQEKLPKSMIEKIKKESEERRCRIIEQMIKDIEEGIFHH